MAGGDGNGDGGDLPGWRMDDSDDEFEKGEGGDRFSGKVATLVVIDVTPLMMTQKWGEEEDGEESGNGSASANANTPFLTAIKCCESLWRSKVISNPQDLVSILLIGTENQRNTDFPNLYELQEFSTVKVDMIKELMEMRKAEDLAWFEEKIGSVNEYNLKDLFWQAKMRFDKACGKNETILKKILFFTAEDNPHSKKPSLQQDAITKFKDLGKLEFSIVSFKEDFAVAKFYKDLVADEGAIICSKNLQNLQKIVRMKQRLRRPISRSTLEVMPGMKVAVGFYSLVRPARQPKTVQINMRNNEVVERTVNTFRSGTALPVLKSEERKVAVIQGESAVFTAKEIKDIRINEDPGLKIVGFLRASVFDHLTCFRSPSYFLYPHDDVISGSQELFTLLLKRCQALERLPVVRYVLTRGKSTKLGVLIPSAAEGEGSHALLPQGFHLFPIPFSDEVRKHTDLIEETRAEAPQQLVALMEKVVKRLSNSSFDLMDVQNPFLQSFWRKLEELALEEEEEEKDEMFDFTDPNEDLMKERLKNLPKEIEESSLVISKSFGKTKSTARVTKPRVDIEMEARHGRLLNCTCAQLREYLKSRGTEVPLISGKKYLMNLVNKSLGYNTN